MEADPPTNPEAEKLTSYPLFDWLRFILASVVVLGHSDFPMPAFLTGSLAVDVFFALSGWLIGGILLRTKRPELPRFFFNRATRIWIPYAFAIAALYSVALLKEGWSYYWLKYLILDSTFTHQLFTIFPVAHQEMPLEGSGNQFWSISVEEQFYLLAPLVMLFTPMGRSLPLWGIIAAFTLVMGWDAAPIALGVCGAIVESRTGFSSWKSTRWAAIAAVLLGAAFLIWGVWTAYVAPLFSVAVVIATAVPGARNAVAVIAGGLSYPLYLNHWIGVFAVNFVTKRYVAVDHLTKASTSYALNVAIALVLYFLIDRQIQERRNAWYTPAVGRGLGLTAYSLVAVGLVLGTAMTLYGPHA